MRAEQRGAQRLVEHCAAVRAGEHVLVLCDPGTRAVAEHIADAARQAGAGVELAEIAPLRNHGQEPPPAAGEAMRAADVVFGATAMSLAHTDARRHASAAGARFLSLPDYTLAVLAGEALRADFRALTAVATRVAESLSGAGSLRLTTPAGTDLRLDASGRTGNAAPGWCDGPGTLASPPDAEANVALVEDAGNGLLVVDGSIPCPELGLLASPLRLHVADGRVQSVEGDGASILQGLLDRPGDSASRVVAELGIGLNPRARVVGSMLEDEGAAGTVHIGIGANIALGGRNRVPFHLDHVLREPTLVIGSEPILVDGRLIDSLGP